MLLVERGGSNIILVASYEDFSRLSNQPMDLYVKGARVRADLPPPAAAARASKARRFVSVVNSLEVRWGCIGYFTS